MHLNHYLSFVSLQVAVPTLTLLSAIPNATTSKVHAAGLACRTYNK
jgi:hypothetical protein